MYMYGIQFRNVLCLFGLSGLFFLFFGLLQMFVISHNRTRSHHRHHHLHVHMSCVRRPTDTHGYHTRPGSTNPRSLSFARLLRYFMREASACWYSAGHYTADSHTRHSHNQHRTPHAAHPSSTGKPVQSVPRHTTALDNLTTHGTILHYPSVHAQPAAVPARSRR
jgi:hypothetical protein